MERSLQLRVDQQLHDAVTAAASNAGVARSEWIRTALANSLARLNSAVQLPEGTALEWDDTPLPLYAQQTETCAQTPEPCAHTSVDPAPGEALLGIVQAATPEPALGPASETLLSCAHGTVSIVRTLDGEEHVCKRCGTKVGGYHINRR